MTRVKICGIQRPEHALVATEAGADYIGLVFVPGSRRRVEIAVAQEIISTIRVSGSNASGRRVPQRKAPKIVGLFADQAIETVNQIVTSCLLDLVQLCGQESMAYCQQVSASVIKVVHVPGSGIDDATRLSANLRQIRESGHLVILDRHVAGRPGGTGKSFDWDIAARLSLQGHQFLLAGGLTPENVAVAVATARPWGVDVSSGVETGGLKDPDKIRAFVENANLSGE